jgi:hypothetical protein
MVKVLQNPSYLLCHRRFDQKLPSTNFAAAAFWWLELV